MPTLNFPVSDDLVRRCGDLPKGYTHAKIHEIGLIQAEKEYYSKMRLRPRKTNRKSIQIPSAA